MNMGQDCGCVGVCDDGDGDLLSGTEIADDGGGARWVNPRDGGGGGDEDAKYGKHLALGVLAPTSESQRRQRISAVQSAIVTAPDCDFDHDHDCARDGDDDAGSSQSGRAKKWKGSVYEDSVSCLAAWVLPWSARHVQQQLRSILATQQAQNVGHGRVNVSSDVCYPRRGSSMEQPHPAMTRRGRPFGRIKVRICQRKETFRTSDTSSPTAPNRAICNKERVQ